MDSRNQEMVPAQSRWVHHLLQNPQAKDDFLAEIDHHIHECYRRALDIERVSLEALRGEKTCWMLLRSRILQASNQQDVLESLQKGIGCHLLPSTA